MALEFGIFDHVDRSDLPLDEFYESRLKLIEAYDRAGIYGYHCAEHHSTPLGMSPSPSVYLSAIAQRTKRLHFGPLVYTLALYHPLRLAEEICMLDQMSRGRFFVGVGKGISPIEVGYYGFDYAKADRMFNESMTVIRQALTQQVINFEGEFYTFKDVPFELAPYSKPHPKFWYGIISPQSAARAAQADMNFVANSPTKAVRTFTDAYRAAYQGKPGIEAPKMGMNRFLYVGETEKEALEIARRAYKRWWASFMALWHKHNRPPVGVAYPPEIDGQLQDSRAVVGTVEQVTGTLRAQLAESGANYLVVRFAYGDLTLAESLNSLDLFQRHVMPALRQSAPVAAA